MATITRRASDRGRQLPNVTSTSVGSPSSISRFTFVKVFFSIRSTLSASFPAGSLPSTVSRTLPTSSDSASLSPIPSTEASIREFSRVAELFMGHLEERLHLDEGNLGPRDPVGEL